MHIQNTLNCATLSKAMAANRKVVLLHIFCYTVLTGRLAEALTADIVFDVLSRRFDYAIREIENVKSNVADIKDKVNRIEKRIENVEKNVSDIVKIAETKEEKIPKPDLQYQYKRQSRTFQKMLAAEKTILRESVVNLQDMFRDLQSNIKLQMSSMNVSVGNSIKEIEQTVSDHIADTNVTLRDMDTNLVLGINETGNRVDEVRQEVIQLSDDSLSRVEEMRQEVKQMSEDSLSRVEEMRQEVKQMSEDSLSRVKEVGESIKATATQDVSNAKDEFSNQLNSEISKMTSQLNSLERKHERHEDEVGGTISDLKRRISTEESYTSDMSKRISAEEERKVAFSAVLGSKQSYNGSSERILFNYAIYSYGGGYDSSTGMFTAPKSGTYLFIFNVKSETKGMVHVTLSVRGHIKARVVVESRDSGANAGIEYLWKGDQAWIETSSLPTVYYILPWFTTFNGILID